MDNSTFWTSTTELITWLNSTLNVKLTKIEEVRKRSGQYAQELGYYITQSFISLVSRRAARKCC